MNLHTLNTFVQLTIIMETGTVFSQREKLEYWQVDSLFKRDQFISFYTAELY